MKDKSWISGGVSGAISEPLSPKAIEHANKYYEAIRHRTDDVKKIANYTGHTIEEIGKIKNYLFLEEHNLSAGLQRFDPSFEIAETWQRLSDEQDYVQYHDTLLIPHELKEIELIDSGMTQEEAHRETCRLFDYPGECEKFYSKLRMEKHARIEKH